MNLSTSSNPIMNTQFQEKASTSFVRENCQRVEEEKEILKCTNQEDSSPCLVSPYTDEYKEITKGTESIKYLHAKHIGSTVENVASKVIQPLDLDNDKIIDIAMKSKQGQAFNTLYQGLWSGLYPSQSEADQAFCQYASLLDRSRFQ